MRAIIVNRMKGPEPSPDTLGALEAYVRSLGFPLNPNLNADGTPAAAAPAAAKRGYAVFMRAGCQACHVPPSFDKKEVEDVFTGGKFKVPSLRVVSRTAPYLHDGRFATLEQTVRSWSTSRRPDDREADGKRPARPGEFLRIL